MTHSPLLEEFLDAKLKGENTSPVSAGTLVHYRHRLRQLEEMTGKPLHEIEEDDVEEAIRQAETFAASAYNRFMAVGRAFFEWALDTEQDIALDFNPFERRQSKPEKHPVTEPSPLMEEFLDAKAKGIKFAGKPASPKTISTYRQQLRRLERYAGKPLHEMTVEDVEKAVSQSIDENLSPSYRNQMVSAGRGFFDWALRNRKEVAETFNPFSGIKVNTRVAEKHPKGITQQQYDAIIRAIKQIDAENVAHALAMGPKLANMPWVRDEGRLPKKLLPVHLMYYGGLRISEAVSLKIDDVMDDGIIVEGKGSKQRFVPLPQWLIRELKDYIHEHSEDDTYVFTPMQREGTREGEPLSTSSVHVPFKEAVERAGLPSWVTPHSLRHSFAKRALDRTGRIDVVQDLLGHAHTETTRVYAKNDREDIRKHAANIWGS